jgi:hypothetical protein
VDWCEFTNVSEVALMMEAVQTSETPVNSYQSTRRYNPEDGHHQDFRYSYCGKNVDRVFCILRSPGLPTSSLYHQGHFTLNVEAICSSETLVTTYKTTQGIITQENMIDEMYTCLDRQLSKIGGFFIH